MVIWWASCDRLEYILTSDVHFKQHHANVLAISQEKDSFFYWKAQTVKESTEEFLVNIKFEANFIGPKFFQIELVSQQATKGDIYHCWKNAYADEPECPANQAALKSTTKISFLVI